MQIILKKNHENLGNQGDMLNVAEGYFRNYLAPQGVAVVATPANKKHFETIIKQRAKKIQKEKVEQESLAKKLESSVVLLKARAGANRKLFGAVNSRQIAQAIHENLKMEVSSKRIRIAEPIRSEGEYTVGVKLFHGVNAKIKIKVDAVIEKDTELEAKVEMSRKKRRAILLDVVSKLEPQDESGYVGIQISTGIEGQEDLTSKNPEKKKRARKEKVEESAEDQEFAKAKAEKDGDDQD